MVIMAQNVSQLEKSTAAGNEAASEEDDVGCTVSYAEVPWRYSTCEIEFPEDLESEQLPYNKTGEVWDFENVPEETDGKTKVIRTTFTCYDCTTGLWDAAFEPKMHTELCISLDANGVLLYNVNRQVVTSLPYDIMRSLHHVKRQDINILVIECSDKQGNKKQYPIAAHNTAEIKAAIVAMITRHTNHIPKSKRSKTLEDKISDFFNTII